MKRFKWDKKYLYWGITAFCVIGASLVLYLFLTHFYSFKADIGKLLDILSPFVWGVVIAYLLSPVLSFYERTVFTPVLRALFKKKPLTEAKEGRAARALAVLFSELTLIIIVAALLWLILPQLYSSIESIVVNSNDFMKRATDWIYKTLDDYPEIERYILTVFDSASDSVLSLAEERILPQLSGLLTDVTSGVFVLLKGLYNVFVGLIVSVYVLSNKETFAAYGKKFLYCIFSLEAGEKILNAVHFTDKVFVGFISGKLVDSAIIGVICYIVCTLLGMPYTMLVSFIIGITNIIPFFGPFIGAVPSAIIILTVSPVKCLIFIVFVFLLQQFDGNILGPKILGQSVGVNGFWVMFSIILGAGLFGFAGMLLGVPVFVIIYQGIRYLVNRKLKRSDLPVSTKEYMSIRCIDPATGQPVPAEIRPRTEGSRRRMERRRGKAKKAPSGKTAGAAQSAEKGIDEEPKDGGKS